MKHKELTEQIIGCAYRVYKGMGFGFLEAVYEKCLAIELRKLGLKADFQRPITVRYEGEIVGQYFADVFVEELVIVELKSIRQLTKVNEVQLVNYLVATNTDVGLLINFGEKTVEVKRKLRTLK